MATSTLRTNSDNDLVLFDGRNLQVIDGIEACAQTARSRTLLRKGENIYNTSEGVDYFGLIFTPRPNYDLGRQSIIDEIERGPDIREVESIDIQVNGDIFNFQAVIVTTYGKTRITNL